MRTVTIASVGLALATVAAAQTAPDSALGRFYEGRWWRTAWVEANTGGPEAVELLRILTQAGQEGLDPDDYPIAAIDSLLQRHLSPDDAWRLDTLLTSAFLRYASDISRGRVEPALVDSQWTAAAPGWDGRALLEQALDRHRIAAALRAVTPSQPGYVRLRVALRRYVELARLGDWPRGLKRRLASEGYDTTTGVQRAVQHFQLLHGLSPDGIVGPETRRELEISPAARVRQIALNLERWRWLPRELGSRYIIVNTPAFTLELVDHDSVAFATRAVVGRIDWPTPITSARATDIIFRPVWRVPRAIAAQELLPLIQRDTGYIERTGFRVFSDSLDGDEVNPRDVDWRALTESTFAYQLVQEPGPENPLGAMKLMFWTPFSVFIHDTPAQPSFTERWRTFSHGCVRVQHAAELAALLLPTWSPDSIRMAMRTGRQRWVRLPHATLVHLVYWTAWVAEDGLVAFAGDPYGWDEKLERALHMRRAQPITLSGEPNP